MNYHQSVMLDEAVELLKVKVDGKYIDATLGDGGHAVAIMQKGGFVLGIDVDDGSLGRAKERVESGGLLHRFKAVKGNFKDIFDLGVGAGFEKVDGILYDLGYSSSQLDAELGLSFLQDQPLDMRLDTTLGVSAADLVNVLSENDLAKLIFDLSDEKLAKRFAHAIVEARSLKKFESTSQLAKVLADSASPGYENGRIHPATRTFQALRIAVNDELKNLEVSLPRAARLLLPGGRLIVISFHSKEDKLVKQFGRGARPSLAGSHKANGLAKNHGSACGNFKTLTKKPLEPSQAEVNSNYRSRSAKLRAFEKI